jgi:hypothetical protein
MAVSTQTLFHFTNSIDALRSILEGDFYPRLCFEDFAYILGDKSFPKFAIPMVCFCDIPLHLIKPHMNEYGHYGLGLKKEWGIKNALSPIYYSQTGSHTHYTIKALHQFLAHHENVTTPAYGMNLIWNLLAFTKPYSGKSHKTGADKIFYDEREWRYFPNFFEPNGIDANIPMLMEGNYTEENRNNLTNYLKRFPLRYTPDDIKYIAVKNESEIYDVSKMIDEIKSDKYTAKELSILKTKIIPSEYLIADV